MFSKLRGARRQAGPMGARENVLKVVRRSEVEAKTSRAKYIEAEHMLLALATNEDSDVGRLLAAHGLDHQRLASVFRDERRRSLAFAGIETLGVEPADVTVIDGSLSLGTSAKAAIKRAVFASRANRPRRMRLESADLLIGILQAELGTVPRALAIAKVDRAALISLTRNPGRHGGQPC
jgi:ATP-dependent Clp protease ATP-binding subunit ClpA